MKLLQNKQTEIDLPANAATEGVKKVTYADLIKLVCNTMIPGGYAINDIKNRITISGACDGKEVDAVIELENAEALYLQNAVKNQKWFFSHKDIIAFVEDVEKMEVKK